MFTSISWVDYLVVVALLLSVYYLIMGVYFYSRGLRHFFAGLQKDGIRAGPDKNAGIPIADSGTSGFYNMEAEPFTPQEAVAQTTDNTFQEVEQLIAQLIEAIGEVQAKKYSKEEFILLLQMVLKEYPAFRGTPFESAIREVILSECKKQDSISLTEEDILQLFREVASGQASVSPHNDS